MSFLRLAILKIIYQILILLACYAAFRWLFYAFNHQEIADVSTESLGSILSGGLRFDLSALAFLNVLWVVVTLIFPLDIKSKWTKRAINASFYLPNIIAILFEVSDWAYFGFNGKRATFEVFNLIFTKGDFLNLLPNYLIAFWYLPVIAIVFIMLIIWSHRRLNRRFAEQWRIFKALGFKQRKIDLWLFRPLCVLLISGLMVLFMRGGWQLMPVNARNAVEYVRPEQTALVLNTPFSIITSAESDQLRPLYFMSDEAADAIIRPIKRYHDGPMPQPKKNVVVIVWESLSKRFTRTGSGDRSLTPFLDSLSLLGRNFNNAYANALRSNEGIPAIFSGLPAMMEGPVTTSVYANNQFSSLPRILQNAGYATAFFHGGNNGTMSFDTYAKNAGFNHYFGRMEYGRNSDHDGTWGIWDQPFLQFAAAQLNHMERPFFAGIFTLSSHFPFKVPKGFVASTLNARSDLERSMNYTDQALKAFFETVAGQPWYHNTVFLITADHACPVAEDAFHIDGLGRYQIPMILFDPSDRSVVGEDSSLVQQLDIMPTLLDHIAYPEPFFSLGNSAFDSSASRYFITYLSGNYNLIKDGWQLKTHGYDIKNAFRYPEDVTNSNDLIDSMKNKPEFLDSERFMQAFLQLLHKGMINDELNTKTYTRQLRKQ